MAGNILAIDQGTTSSRAIIFNAHQEIIAQSQKELSQHFPQPGWVEHDPVEIWHSVFTTAKEAIAKANVRSADIAAIGITNQRETTILWDRESAAPLHPAIVWQDRRTGPYCKSLKESGHEDMITEKTGLLLDPYFSATKLSWLLDNISGARAAAESGKLCFGTVDSWLIYKLTAGAVHATDATNAARTMLYNINENEWDEELLTLFNIPRSVLPAVKDCAADYGNTARDLFGAPIPIKGVAGDQQAATLGNACFQSGMMKATYGTGCFALLNTGDENVRSSNRLLSTIAYRLNGKTTYALEGSIFIAGAAVQWLRDGLGIIKEAAEAGPLAEQARPDEAVYLVPAFTGLGAPHWDAEARGALFGLTRATGRAEIAKAALESVAYQTADLFTAMQKDWATKSGPSNDETLNERARATILRVDGGMVASNWTMQSLADILAAPVDRPQILETTALGTAWLAGSHAGVWPDQQAFAENWALERRFTPQISQDERAQKISGWQEAVRRTLTA